MARPVKPGWITAKTADINDLYERSVQCPESEVLLIYKSWEELRERRPVFIREDFCGTSAVAREWVKQNETNRVIGVDLDRAVLEWAQNKIDVELTGEQISRIRLVECDVFTAELPPVDCTLAMNFSYYGFKRKSQLLRYFKSVRSGLKDDGLFLLDAYGGSDSFVEMHEERDLDGFTYIWDQHTVNPITGDVLNYIHFEFPDGSKINRAFTYDWRFWTLPELQDALVEAGFSRVVVYWEGTNEDGSGNGDWKIDTRGEACAGWVAYIAALK
ncbi:MAG TPA: class I SAM-dependent methyltransferase [Phycisphaerales bacterium]|nr:class I SAM-dependent methyltransferase [Phycisphaerales bacterium]